MSHGVMQVCLFRSEGAYSSKCLTRAADMRISLSRSATPVAIHDFAFLDLRTRHATQHLYCSETALIYRRCIKILWQQSLFAEP